MHPGVIVIFSTAIIIVLGDLRKPPSDKIYFFHGLRDLQDLRKFFNSRSLAARETVFLEHAPPHRLVMGHENSTWWIECDLWPTTVTWLLSFRRRHLWHQGMLSRVWSESRSAGVGFDLYKACFIGSCPEGIFSIYEPILAVRALFLIPRTTSFTAHELHYRYVVWQHESMAY